jgi:hypothetical protein
MLRKHSLFHFLFGNLSNQAAWFSAKAAHLGVSPCRCTNCEQRLALPYVKLKLHSLEGPQQILPLLVLCERTLPGTVVFCFLEGDPPSFKKAPPLFPPFLSVSQLR